MGHNTILFLIISLNYLNCSFGQVLEYDKDLDIQNALIGISRRLDRRCPVVLVYDEEMPELSMSYMFVKKMQKHGRQFIMLNLSSDKLPALLNVYGSNSPSDIIKALLHILYRKRSCYTFLVWVKDPRILYPEIETKYHPGWRRSDSVIIVSQHITKRYRTFINLRIWNHIPNIIGLKRSKDGLGINIFTVLPYYHGKKKPQELDVWLTHERTFVRNSSLFFEKFDNLHTAPIVVGVFWKEPFFIWGNINDPYLDGLDWRIFQLCIEKLNFTIAILSVNTTGRKLGNDTWSGMMGVLANGDIDVGLGGLEVTSDRLQDFGFCRTYYTDSYNFIVPLNPKLNTAVYTFFKPLRSEVWICILISGLVGITTLTVVAHLELRFTVKDAATERNWISDRHFASFFHNCGFLITALCQKPYRRLPKSLAMQLNYYGLSSTLFLIGMAFSSCLISVVLNVKPEPIANDVEDILKLRLPIAIKEYDGHLNEFMQNSGNPTLKAIYSSAEHVDYFQSFLAMDDVVKGKKIYIDSTAKIHFNGRYRYTGAKGLKFHISSGKVLEFANLGWPVQKNWPLIPKMDSIISRAVESGLVKHWMSQFMEGQFGRDGAAWEIRGFNLTAKTVGAHGVDPSEDVDEGFVSLSMNHVGGAISLYILGMLLSILTFIIECTAGLLRKLWTLLRFCYHKHYNKNSVVSASSVSNEEMRNSDFLQKNVVRIRNKRKVLRANYKREMRNLEKNNIRNSEYPELIWNDFVKMK